MRLRTKIITLAIVPLLVALALVAAAVRHQERELAQRAAGLIEETYMAQRRTELRSYIDLAVSTVRPLYDTGRDDDEIRAEALQRLATLDYGSDGYFFVYDLQGRNLMHSREPQLVGRDLWALRDSQGRLTIQQLIAQARAGGYVEYEWRKPSNTQPTPKLGYVMSLPRWNWMLGTGLYLDDIDRAMRSLDGQMTRSVGTTMLWIAAIAATGLGIVSATGLLLNLSEHRASEAKLRLLARQVVQSQEDERSHLARELHDGTSQTLVSAKLLIETAVDALDRRPEAAPPVLSKALQRLNDSLTEVRRISHRLRPAMLDTLGLPAALEHLGREFDEEGEVRATVAVEGLPHELPPEVKTALFRVTQEALTNVRKHAGARQVTIALDFSGRDLRLEIRDDGTGFDAAALHLDPRRGIGLRNMRERLEAIGGRFEVHASPSSSASGSAGTRIVATLPMRETRTRHA